MATKTKIYFVLEYAKGGELFDKVAKGRLNEDVAWKYFYQLIHAIDFCHSRGVYHRDIKPENLLLDENENLKVSDFGLSALVESGHRDGLLHTICGTPAYVAPEVISRKGYDGAKADIWSCGVVLFVLLAGYLPFHDSNLMEMYRKIEKADYKCPSWFPREMRRLLSRMLDPNPVTRTSVAMIRQSSWFKKGLRSMNVRSGTKDDAIAAVSDGNQEMDRPPTLNAFDLVSLSTGFDLSSLFEDDSRKKERLFTCRKPASVLLSKLEEIAKLVRFRVQKKEAGLLRLEALTEGKKGVLSIDTEIYEVTPSFYLVEMKKSNGDTLEYQKILKEDIRPALQDIVWVWRGEHEQQ
ncbi:CBL-interacting serine/threonine-protein kinase 10, partial [Cucurbita argyrosperma subsp. argyrosperma]